MIIGKTWRNGDHSVQIRMNMFGETWVTSRMGLGTSRRQLAHTDKQAVDIFKSEVIRLGGHESQITE